MDLPHPQAAPAPPTSTVDPALQRPAAAKPATPPAGRGGAPRPLLPESEPQLVVTLGEALYAIPIGGIEEILPMREVAPLPRSSPTVRGILFLRGHPVTVLDLGLLLGRAPARGTRIVVLLMEKERYGVVVDAVLKVAAPAAFTDAAEPPAALNLTPALRGVARLGEEIVSLLDIDLLLPAPTGVRTGA